MASVSLSTSQGTSIPASEIRLIKSGVFSPLPGIDRRLVALAKSFNVTIFANIFPFSSPALNSFT